MRKSIVLLLLASSALAQVRVCQKFDKQAHTFVDVPCKVQKVSKPRAFWSKVGRDARETLEVTAIVAITGGYLYLRATTPSSGVRLR